MRSHVRINASLLCDVRDMQRVKWIGIYFAEKTSATGWFSWQQSGELEAYSDSEWESTRPVDDRSQPVSS